MNWTRGQLIGHGSSAAVSLGRLIPSGDNVAVKSVEFWRSNCLQKEKEIHSTLNCDRIIEYKGCDVTLENGKLFFNIFTEYASHGTLIDVSRRQNSGLSEPHIRKYTRDVLLGLGYLHFKGIVHCDVKGANIFVTTDGVKIGDFGCSKQVDHEVARPLWSIAMAGTPMYMAPEVARGEHQGFAADIWALGCTVLEMATGLAPWPNVGHDTASALYWIGFSGQQPEIPGFLSGQAKDFLTKCLKANPKERWSIDELLKHPFVSEGGLAHLEVKEVVRPRSKTPTSVMDQGLWESIKQMGSAQNNSDVAQEVFPKFLDERMREWTLPISLNEFPNWALDEDWISVRSNTCDKEGKDFFVNINSFYSHW